MVEFHSIFLLFIFFALGLFLINIFTSIWAYRDARRLGHSSEYSLIVLIATLFFPVIGLIVYLIIRKDT
ncbi:PLDc N-terminal domain-containing protein [Bacillus shivajii]|uniref:PLDc N-terminal domain-containing protein n=1 Tax=Bacillus shivajii TaxID=1983719 RepID=UPI001CFB10FA|nr:PLDc N-terminal domain-containing protein [Bacillus shivajii]UCZ55243.1 PLDc N-terminal domain-containing protein [Bacillus shivajii]